jgi:predicted nuclease of restriction endonuclease-like (RecB) superfamily
MARDLARSEATTALYQSIRQILERARNSAYRAVNFAMVQAYWRVGYLIVEHEQGGKKRADYGEALLNELAQKLTQEFGRGFDSRNLRYMRQFYLSFPSHQTTTGELAPSETWNAARSKTLKREIRNAARSKSANHLSESDESALSVAAFPTTLRPELSWTHYRLLLRVESPQARDWYMNEAADQNWSSRQLDRQISVLYYERLLASRDKPPVRKEAKDKISAVEPEHFIRDPYVLEFLDLKDYPALRESVVEQAIIDNMQAFLLELGRGFSFVARQKRMRFEDEDFYVDLVFYNFLLKCFVLIDLKIGKLTHQDIGQMDGYVRMFEAHAKVEGDNPTIGLILCSKKNEAVAKYSVLKESKHLFAARYMDFLPTEEELQRELKRERRLIDARQAEENLR